MEGWNLEKVKALKEQYEAAGVTSSSSYRFLSSLVQEGKPPRGRGIAWLQSLLIAGPPGDIKVILTRIDRIRQVSNAPDLDRISQMLKSSGRIESWQLKKIEEAEADLEKGHMEVTPEKLNILMQIHEIGKHRHTWWVNRPAQHRRFTRIFDDLSRSNQMLLSDFDFITGLFGPAYRELTNPTFAVGDLVKIKRRYYSGVDLLGVVTTSPKVRRDAVVYEVLTSDEGIIFVERDFLSKRLK